MTDVDLRRRLIETTVALLGHVEPNELSLRQVARGLGVSSGAPYHHFTDKPELLAAVAAEGWEGMNAALADAASAPGDPSDRLFAMGLAYLRFALHRPAHYRVMFLPELKDLERFGHLHDASTRALGGLLALVAEALSLPVESPELMTRVVGSWSTVHGFAVLSHSGVLVGKADHLPAEDLVRGVVEAAVRAALGDGRSRQVARPGSGPEEGISSPIDEFPR